jgi:hypothetical protein
LAPAIFTVNTPLDTVDANPGDGRATDANGFTSLRAAIMEANAHSDADQIILPAGTYNLTLAGVVEDLAASGDLDITSDLTITGPSAATTIVNASTIPGGDRVFDCIGSINVRLTGLTITGGNVVGDGGGIFNREGTLSVSACTVTGNTSIVPPIESYTPGGCGGGIASGDRSVYTPAGTLEIESSIVTGNHASEGGGFMNCATATVIGSQISGNSAINDGGGSFNLNNSSFATDQCTLVNSTVSGNTAVWGGGINNAYYGHATVNNCTISGNLAQFGAGIVCSGSELSVSNSTITSNGVNGTTATGGEFGGGLYLAFHSVVSLDHVTLSGNIANFGSGISNSSWIYGGTLTVGNSIIAYNTGQEIQPLWNRNYFSGSPGLPTGLTSLGHNIDSDGSCGFGATGDLSLVDPLLGPLADNGGPTLTCVLLAGSPAIDAGDPLDTTLTDQRDFNRPADGNGDGVAIADIGAYELGANANVPPVITSFAAPASGMLGQVLHFTGAFIDPDTETWNATVDFGDGSGAHSLIVNPDKTFAFDHVFTETGTYTLFVTVSDIHGGVGSRSATVDIVNVTGPAIYTVNGGLDNTTSDDLLTLREAILLVDHGGDAFAALGRNLTFGEQRQITGSSSDAIQFDPSLNGQTITLTSDELLISKNVAIDGPGASNLTVSGNGVTRVFEIGAGTVSIDGLTIAHGFSADFGGGILNQRQGRLTVSNCTVSDNAANQGGGIFNFFDLTVSNCNLIHNGALAMNLSDLDNSVSPRGFRHGGGGIFNGGILTVSGSMLADNFAADSGGGIFNDGALTVTNSTLTRNSADDGGLEYFNPIFLKHGGGGIYNARSLHVSNCEISHNSSIQGNGGGILTYESAFTIIDSTMAENKAEIVGGGIDVSDGSVTASNCTFIGNLVFFSRRGRYRRIRIRDSP